MSRVKCEACRCWLSKEDAQKVSIYQLSLYPYSKTLIEEYYCQSDKKSYDKLVYYTCLIRGYKKSYYKELEVNEQGEPIGYVKVKTK